MSRVHNRICVINRYGNLPVSATDIRSLVNHVIEKDSPVYRRGRACPYPFVSCPDFAIETNLLFCRDSEIRALNNAYLNRDSVTDVIAFREDGKFQTNGKGHIYLGEIVVSIDTAKRQARQYGVPLNKEVKLLVIHGILHLLGYDDSTKSSRVKMKKKEKSLLKETIGNG